MKPIKNIQGQRFGRLIILKNSGKRCGGHVIWLCRCDCGNFTEVRSISLRNGRTKSCGCLQKEKAILANKKHGEATKRTRLYVIWQGIKWRCYNSKNKAFEHYGGRGIKVCDEWKNNYSTFKLWALLSGYQNNLTIDRIDNDSDYCPENCQWITRSENTKKGLRHRITPRMYREQILKLKEKEGEVMNHYRCNIDGYLYPEKDLILTKDMGLICKNCASSMKELDQEQEDIERQMRAEKKMKAGIY